MNINKIIISGYLGQNPLVKATNSGKYLATFSVGNTTGWGESEKTSFFKVVAWNKTAEYLARYGKKGDFVVVVGRLDKNEFTDKSGQTCKDYSIIADDVELKSKGNGQTQQQPTQQPQQAQWSDTQTAMSMFGAVELDADEQSIPF